MGHWSKFVLPGSWHLSLDVTGDIPQNVEALAFQNENQTIIVLRNSGVLFY
jgi:hypothetical protein